MITKLGKGSNVVKTDNLHFASITTNTVDTFTIDTPVQYAGMASLKETTNETKMEFKAGGSVYESMTKVDASSYDIVVPGLTPEVKTNILGYKALDGALISDGLSGNPVVVLWEEYHANGDVTFCQAGCISFAPPAKDSQSDAMNGITLKGTVAPPTNGKFGARGLVELTCTAEKLVELNMTLEEVRTKWFTGNWYGTPKVV